MKTALVWVFAVSYLFSMLKSLETSKTSVGAGILSSVIAITSAVCLMILTYLR